MTNRTGSGWLNGTQWSDRPRDVALMKCRVRWLVGMAVLLGVSMGNAFASETKVDLSVRTSGGHVFKVDAQRGHWIIINYWATWCEACRDEMPMLAAFAASHPSVRMIGLTYENIAPAALRQFLAAHPTGYPVAQVSEDKLPRALKPTYFGIHALPLTYVITPDGVVAKRWVGELDRTKLQALVGKRHN
ncbi:MAG: TlpA family protein disulfide reductase [Rhodanobacter sp.]|nr:MAG: TlpA family protein disulfide reductase [Rhodanobacter sp.]